MLNRSIAPPVASIDKIELLKLHQLTFPNHFNVYYIHSSESDIIQLSFYFKSGFIYQNKKLLTQTFTSLLNNGTLHHNAQQIAELLEYYGVFYSIEPFPVFTKLQFTLLKKNLIHVLPVIEEIIKYANFPEDEINIYIKNATEQYQTQIKNVSTLAQWHYSQMIYGNKHPLNKLHTPEDYKQISRDDLLYFFTTHVHPKNGFIFISGNIDDNILNLLEKHFGKEDFHQSQHQYNTNVPLPESFEKHIYIHQTDALQSAIRVGMPVFISYKDADYFDFVIANTLFGGYFGSRLMSVIREEKGYTYGIYSALTTYDTYSVFTIASEIKAEHTQAAIDEIIRQIQVLQNTPPDEEELEILKNYLSGEILDNTDGILKQHNTWASIITRQLPTDYHNRFLSRIKSIQPQEISNAFKKYIDVHQIAKCIVGKM